MKSLPMIRMLFAIAALYDGLLGLIFLFAGYAVFDKLHVTPPNHPGYMQFSAGLLVIFGLMFAAIARNPKANANLIPYGILLKITYCSVVGYHWFTTDLPTMWKPFWVMDMVFLVLFVWAWKKLGCSRPNHPCS